MRSLVKPRFVHEYLALASRALRDWNAPTWLVALLASVGVAVVIGIATVLIPNPLFARDIPPVWWNYPVWLLTSLFSGMLLATYTRARTSGLTAANVSPVNDESSDRPGRLGMVGTVIAWFAVGCPVCNKIALLALGYSGALTWFAPFQPILAIGALVLTGTALVARLRGEIVCALPKPRAEVAA